MQSIGHTIIARRDGKLVARFDREGHLARETISKTLTMPTGRVRKNPEDEEAMILLDRYRLVEANYRAQRFTYVYETTD